MKLYLTILYIFLQGSVLAQNKSKTFLFVGSYTDGKKADGIYIYEFNTKNGKLKEVERGEEIINPSFLTISPNGKYLYACTETKLETHGSVSAFKIDTLSGQITFLNKQTTGTRNPVHVLVGKQNKYVFSASYTDAGVNVFKCNADGSLAPHLELIKFKEGSGIIPNRQAASHVHSVNLSFDNKYLFAPDLGADKIRAFTFDAQNLLTEADELTVQTEEGSGPRHFTFHPNNKYAYCIEELGGKVSAYSYYNGQLTWLASYFSNSKKHPVYASSDIHISPDGKFLYAANRLEDENTIAIFKIEQATGKLTLVGHQSTLGNHPRSFIIDPTGKFLIVANQLSNSVIVFKRNTKTGLLTQTKTKLEMDAPSSLKMRTYGNAEK